MPKVDGFRDAADVLHLPGDIVDLPASYEGETWLERVDPVPVVAAVPGKVEPVEPAETVPLEDPSQKRTQKKSKS